MPIIKMPDGVNVSFPDDMPPEQIKGMIASKLSENNSPRPFQQIKWRKLLKVTAVAMTNFIIKAWQHLRRIRRRSQKSAAAKRRTGGAGNQQYRD